MPDNNLTESQIRAIVRDELLATLALVGLVPNRGDADVVEGPDADGFVKTKLSKDLLPDCLFQWDETWPLMTTDRQRAGLNLNCSVTYDGHINREAAAWIGFADSGDPVTDCASFMPHKVDVRTTKNPVTGAEEQHWFRTEQAFQSADPKFPTHFAIRADAKTFNEWVRRTAAERNDQRHGTGNFSPAPHNG